MNTDNRTAIITGSAGGTALPLTVDITSNSEVRSAVDKVRATYGRIDVPVNNTGADYLVDGGRVLGPRGA